jgi:2-keto-4-pentenoate hydratase/2-oxohepta-3-ene-1,7-dioic acid hydratase in catechol pathway
MKIVRYTDKKTNRPVYGALERNNVYPVVGFPFSTPINCYERNEIPYDEAILLAPCEPTKVIALAINYKGATGQTADMSEPLVFLKSSNTVVDANYTVELPFKSKTWGESELGVVIRKTAKNIVETEVRDYILGYVPANDVSCDNVEGRDHHLARSKSADGFCPLGHYIDTDYEFRNKTVLAYHNDILLRQGNTDEMIWNPEKIVVWLSTWMTLYPGDIVITGAPSRVRDRLFLKDRDTYTVEIEGFPKIVTRFRAKQ